MALTAVSLATGHPAAANPLVTSSVSPSTSVVFVWVKLSTTLTVSSISGLNGTWAAITDVQGSNSTNRLSLWVGTGCSGSGALTITPSTTPTSNAYAIEEFTGGINPTTPYVSSNTKTNPIGGSANTSVTITPNALANANNASYFGMGHNVAENVTPSTGQSPGNATEISDDNATTSGAVETNYLLGWTAGAMGGTWSTGARAWAIAIEVLAAVVMLPKQFQPVPWIPLGRAM